MEKESITQIRVKLYRKAMGYDDEISPELWRHAPGFDDEPSLPFLQDADMSQKNTARQDSGSDKPIEQRTLTKSPLSRPLKTILK